MTPDERTARALLISLGEKYAEATMKEVPECHIERNFIHGNNVYVHQQYRLPDGRLLNISMTIHPKGHF